MSSNINIPTKKCVLCHNKNNLLCEKCYIDTTEANKPKKQLLQQSNQTIENCQKLLTNCQHAIMKSMMHQQSLNTNTHNRIQNLKQQISQIKCKLLEETNNRQRLQKIMRSEQGILSCINDDGDDDQISEQRSQSRKCKQENDVRQLYSQQLMKKNDELRKKISFEHREKLRFIEKVFKIHKFQYKKFILQKYFKIKKTQQILYTTEEYSGNGIPFIVAQNQEILMLSDLMEIEDQTQRIQLENKIVHIVFYGTKITTLIHKVFFPDLKLPYKMVSNSEGVYIGDFELCASEFTHQNCKKYAKFGSQSFIKFLARIQANVEFLAWSIGSPNRPLLILDESFFKKLRQNNFTTNGDRKIIWKSSLRELKTSEIPQQQQVMCQNFQKNRHKKDYQDDIDEFLEEQTILPSLTAIKSCQRSFESSDKKQSEPLSDEQFQILE